MLTIPEAARLELRALYAQLASELEPFRRHCDARGLCCNFTATDHMLYVTDLEASEMAACDERPDMALSAEGKCPYLRGKLCGARDHRAIGCRIYFCDRTYEEDRNALYEKYLTATRDIEARHDIEHRYSPIVKVEFEASVI
ncbi:MAG: hypothetical protein WCT04_01665 [Planctomycetota bacterium]